MGFLDALLGRSKQAPANLDRLFGLPGAAITLEAAEALKPLERAAVCFKPMAGQSFEETEAEVASMLSGGPSDPAPSATLSESTDEFGYRWAVVSAESFEDLVTNVHFVNATLTDHGYGPQLLCSVFGFERSAAPGTEKVPPRLYLVYLYKRGTFYPFVPTGADQRDNEAELRLRNEVENDLTIEKELDRWFPIWKLPIA